MSAGSIISLTKNVPERYLGVSSFLEAVRAGKAAEWRKARYEAPTAPQALQPNLCKVRKSASRKCCDTDRFFIEKTEACADSETSGDGLSSIVRREGGAVVVTSISSTPSSPCNAQAETSACDTRKTREEIAAERMLRRLNEGGKARPWRNITDRLRMVYYARVLHSRSSSYSFTLRIAPDLLFGAENPVALMSERLRKTLKRRLGRSVDFFGVVELTGELHVHGAVHCSESERPAVDAALRLAGGKWRSGRAIPRQLKLEPLRTPDDYAGYYCSKELQMTKNELNQRRKALQVNSDREPVPIMVSAPLRREAEERYERDRARMNAERTAPAPAPEHSTGVSSVPAPSGGSTQEAETASDSLDTLYGGDRLARWFDARLERRLAMMGITSSDVIVTPLTREHYDLV